MFCFFNFSWKQDEFNIISEVKVKSSIEFYDVDIDFHIKTDRFPYLQSRTFLHLRLVSGRSRREASIVMMGRRNQRFL